MAERADVSDPRSVASTTGTLPPAEALVARVRAHHHRCRLRLGCQFQEVGCSQPNQPGPMLLYTHAELPWRYFNHALVHDWHCADRRETIRNVVARMFDAQRPACIEIETPTPLNLLLRRRMATDTAALSRSPLARLSRSWSGDLERSGFQLSEELVVMVHRPRPQSDPLPTAEAAPLWERRPVIVRMPADAAERQIDLHREGFGVYSSRPVEVDRLLVEANLAAGVQYLWAMEEGVPVGSAALLVDGDVAELFAISVLPRHRGQGLATQLTTSAVELAREQGCSLVYLQCEPTSRACHLYTRCGFAAAWIQASYLY